MIYMKKEIVIGCVLVFFLMLSMPVISSMTIIKEKTADKDENSNLESVTSKTTPYRVRSTYIGVRILSEEVYKYNIHFIMAFHCLDLDNDGDFDQFIPSAGGTTYLLKEDIVFPSQSIIDTFAGIIPVVIEEAIL
jgi:hypothetical protein